MITDAPPRGERHAIDGERRLMLHRLGEGSPSVVIEAGGGWFGLGWLPVQERLAELTTCVVYDRAGLGWSDPDSEPRTMDRTVEDLHLLLRVAEIPGPYILIGHSLGGIYVRRFAQRYPDEVAGLVLVDPSHEDQWRLMPEEVRQQFEAMRERFESEEPNAELSEEMRAGVQKTFAAWPDEVRDAVIERFIDPDARKAGMAEIRDWDHFGALKEAAMPSVPIVVLTGGRVEPAPGISEDAMQASNEAKLSLHAQLAGLSPNGEQRILDDAGHMINLERPDAIVRAVKDILESIA